MTKNCLICNDTFEAKTSQKYCLTCRETKYKELKRARDYEGDIRRGRIKNPYVGSGGAQKTGEEHPTYVNGIGIYRRIALEHYGYVCEVCKLDLTTIASDRISVHHKNRDRTNNTIENLAVMCKSCHAKEHEFYTNFEKV